MKITAEVSRVWNAFSFYEKDGKRERIESISAQEIKDCMRVFASDSARAPFKLMEWRLMELSQLPQESKANA